MYHRIQEYFSGISPVWIDGTLYVLLALFGAIELTFNSEDIYKYFNYVTAIYWIKHTVGWLIALITAIKMFRDKSFKYLQDLVTLTCYRRLFQFTQWIV